MHWIRRRQLKGWDLGVEFATLHRLLEARMGKAGKREYVQVLRLMENFEMVDVHGAVRQALNMGAIGYDAVKHLLLCRIQKRPPRLDLDIYPYLPRASVETTKPAVHESPGGGGSPMSEAPELLLHHHLKKLRLPTFLSDYEKLAKQCAAENKDHVQYLLRLSELELIERERRMIERRIRAARFPAAKSLDSPQPGRVIGPTGLLGKAVETALNQ